MRQLPPRVVLICSALSACFGELPEEAQPIATQSAHATYAALAVTVAQVEPETCTIRIGGGGKTYEYSAALGEGEERAFPSVPASDFIRSTTGPCHFRIYNGADFSARHVVLGSSLSASIRAGSDGLTRKEAGGGDTWRVRSLAMVRRPTRCRLRLGANGVRMDYFTDYASTVPAMDRVDYLAGGDCASQIHAAREFGADDYNNRSKVLHPTSTNRETYDPGFSIRSLTVWDEGNTCPSVTQDRGRCVAQFTLPASIFVVTHGDDDVDGLDDYREDALAEAFRPAYYNHASEDATRTEIYLDSAGRQVMEPATIFQVRPQAGTSLHVQFMRLWLKDAWNSPTCPGHRGDSQRNSLKLQTTEPGTSEHGKLWYVTETSGGIAEDLRWQKGNDVLRSPHFVRMSNETGPARHLAIHFSKGKHHEYADTGWSGQNDKECLADVAYVNARGHLHDPAYPMRLASLRSPMGLGDRFDRLNVGSRQVPFFDDLSQLGFAGECVWGCGDFYEANSPNRGFE